MSNVLCQNLIEEIIVAGHVNIDVLKIDNKYKLFIELLKSLKMRYLVNFPTWVTETSSLAIDNFLVKNIEADSIRIEGLITCLSDHDDQLLEVNFNHFILNTN